MPQIATNQIKYLKHLNKFVDLNYAIFEAFE